MNKYFLDEYSQFIKLTQLSFDDFAISFPNIFTVKIHFIKLGIDEFLYYQKECIDSYMIQVDLLGIFIKHNILTSSSPNHPHFPIRGKNNSRLGKALKQSDIPIIIEKLFENLAEETIFVIQGGNRYLTKYIKSNFPINVIDKKLLCITKAKLSNIILTFISNEDRFIELTNQERLLIEGSFHIKTKYLYQAIEVIANEYVDTPFKYPYNDKNIAYDFSHMIDIIEKKQISIAHKNLINQLLAKTQTYTILHG
jgi:hypothetical protein